MIKSVSILLFVAITLVAGTAAAQSPGFATYFSPDTGVLDGTVFRVSDMSDPDVSDFDLSGADFQGAAGPGPGSDSEPALTYDALSDWSVEFDAPISVLYIYVVFWRGNFSGAPGAETTYTFSQPFEIVSGLSQGQVTGNELRVPNSGFHSGILKLTNITSLSVDTNATSNSAQVVTFRVPVAPPAIADLRIAKSVSAATAAPGTNFQYTLQVTNDGPNDASNVLVTDTLPSATAFVSCSAPGGTCGGTGNARTISYATLAAGATATVTLTVTLNAGTPDGTVVPNTATVASDTADPDATDNSSTASITARVPHSVKFFLHGHDIPKTAGSFTMNLTATPAHVLALSLASAPSWLSDPALTGTFGSGAQFSVTIPCSLGLGVAVTFRLASTDLNGGNEQSLGSANGPLLCTNQVAVNIPVSAPVTLNNRRLKLVISALIAINLNLQLGPGTFVEGTNFIGTP